MMKDLAFPVPEGFELPEDSSSFDAVATLSLDGDMLVLKSLDGISIGEESSEMGDSDEEPGFLSSVENQLSGPPEA